jgi:hypothetical protein
MPMSADSVSLSAALRQMFATAFPVVRVRFSKNR